MPIKSKRAVKVLIVLYYYHPYVSGVSVYAKRLAEGLAEAGYNVTVLTSRHSKDLPKQEVINWVQVIRRPVLFKLNKGVIMPTLWLDIVRYALKNDYVNPHLPLAESGLASLFIPKKKIITTYQCDINLGTSLIDRLVAFVSLNLMRLQLIRSRAIVPLSADYFAHSKMKKYVPKSLPITPPIPADEFKSVNPRSLFNKLCIEQNTTKIGFVGRIVYEKGIDYLLEAIPYIQKQLKDFKIIIVGDYTNVAGGSVKDKLDAYLEKYPDRIQFTGFLNDKEIVQFYSGIDVLALPSIDPLEAFGMVQVEAMLCGSPVVASDMPGVRYAIQATGYGKLSQPRSPKDIAKQLLAVIKNPKAYKPDRKRVEELFAPSHTIEHYMKLMP